MRLLKKAGTAGLLLATAFAKEVTGVFTSINSIQLSSGSGPFGFYNVELGWLIDTDKVATGDTFTLEMPYVNQVRILTNGALSNYFDITKGSVTIASCTSYPAGGRALVSTIQCQVTSDLSGYSTVSGTVDFTIVFDGGGRTETVDAANHWVPGSNTVTFNDDLSLPVSMQTIDTSSRVFISRITMRGDTFYYYTPPSNICGGGAIKSGTFQFKVQNSQSVIDTGSTEAYITSQLSKFGFPQSYSPLEITSVTSSADGTTITVHFGAIAAGNRFWFSTYTENNSGQYNQYTVSNNFNVVCQAYSPKNSDVYQVTLAPVKGGAGGSGSGQDRPVTVTTTQSADSGTASTKFVTGSDSIVTEIIFTTPSSTFTTTSTWTGAYTTTYFTTGSDSSVTEVVEVPESTFTTTSTWTGAYTTTYFTTGSDSSVTKVVEVPESTFTTTSTWTGAYTTTYFTTGSDSSVTEVVEVPERSSSSSEVSSTVTIAPASHVSLSSGDPDPVTSSSSSDVPESTFTTTSTWTGAYTTTYFTTGSDSSVTEVVEVPESTFTTTSTWTGAYTTTYFTTGSDSSVTEVVEVPESTFTTTSTWTGAYTTTYFTTGSDSSVTEVVEVPERSSSSSEVSSTVTIAPASHVSLSSGDPDPVTSSSSSDVPESTFITTSTWTGAYTTTYFTTGSDSSVTEVVEVPMRSSGYSQLSSTVTMPPAFTESSNCDNPSSFPISSRPFISPPSLSFSSYSNFSVTTLSTTLNSRPLSFPKLTTTITSKSSNTIMFTTTVPVTPTSPETQPTAATETPETNKATILTAVTATSGTHTTTITGTLIIPDTTATPSEASTGTVVALVTSEIVSSTAVISTFEGSGHKRPSAVLGAIFVILVNGFVII